MKLDAPYPMAETKPKRKYHKKKRPENVIPLVAQHIIKQEDARFQAIDEAAFAAKNLYNKALYLVRQSFINEDKYRNFASIFHLIKNEPEYQALPRKVSNQVLIQLHQNWLGFFEAMKAWKQSPDLFLGRPGLPRYKDKTAGRQVLSYEKQAISKRGLDRGQVIPSQLGIDVETNQSQVVQCRIVPRTNHYVVEIVYEVTTQPNPKLDDEAVASIDPGIDNLVTLTSNVAGLRPLIVNGRPLKSMNQFYNKQRANLQAQLEGRRQTSKRLQALTTKRNRKIKDLMHKTSRFIVDHLISQGIGTLVIGRNKNWKQHINIGKVNNQKFVQIPFAQLWQMIEYKFKLAGGKVIFQEESYTSKCSFLDLEPVRKHQSYLGHRVNRGLFKSATGQLINADVNGSLNILRKAIPNAFPRCGDADGIEGVAVRPLRVSIKLA